MYRRALSGRTLDVRMPFQHPDHSLVGLFIREDAGLVAYHAGRIVHLDIAADGAWEPHRPRPCDIRLDHVIQDDIGQDRCRQIFHDGLNHGSVALFHGRSMVGVLVFVPN